MVNINKLKGRIVENDTIVEEMAKHLNVAPSTIYRKIQASGDSFTVKEIEGIIEYLHLNAEETIAIFFSHLIA